MKAAAYARYSTDRQTENSIAYQLAQIYDYCGQHGIEVSAVYTDEGESGTNMERAGFIRLLDAAKKHEFDAVVIYDISRGSRDVGDWFTFRKLMMTLGIRVISATQELGELTDGNAFLLELLTVGLGQREVLETRSKSIAGVAVKAKEGQFLGGTPPLGYDIVDGKYIINPVEAAVVRRIFQLYAAGESYNTILAACSGAVGKRGRPLGKNSLHSILENERYVGVYSWNKRRVKMLRKWAGGQPNPNAVRIEDAIPPIIDADTWAAVQRRLHDNRRNAVNKAKREYLLTGLIECEECGAAYVGHTSTVRKNGVVTRETRWYVCGNKYRTGTCHAKNIKADEIESFVRQSLIQYRHSDLERVAFDIAEQTNRAMTDFRAERIELNEVTAKIANGMQYILSGKSFPELDAELDRLRVRKSELEDTIKRAGSQRGAVDPAKLLDYMLESLDNWDPEDFKSSRDLMRRFVTKIYAKIDGSCTVNLGVHMDGCGGPNTIVCAMPTFVFSKL